MHRTANPEVRQSPTLSEALGYRRRGWSIIPIKAGTKRPACQRWKGFQTEPAGERLLHKWFANGNGDGMAVVLGPVSGRLVCRDFDTMEGYDTWRRSHSDLAGSLPTVATARGRHVYFVADQANIITLSDGELRGAGYCLLPPSRHPSGTTYTWLIPLPDGPLPLIEDVSAAGFLDSTPHATERTESTQENRGLLMITEAIKGVSGEVGSTSPSLASVAREDDRDLDQLIRDSLPTHTGRRNRQVFELARVLKSVPWLADAGAAGLKPHVQRWHDLGLAKGVIGTVPFEETWIDFLQSWPKVKSPKGAERMTAIFEAVQAAPVPKVALQYEQQGLRLLVGLCRELQCRAGDEPFFLACRTAGNLLGVDHTTAWRWLFLLGHDGIVEEVEKGNRRRRRASRYRYVAC